LTGARARFVPFAGLLTWRWCNYTTKQFDALKTKNAQKICKCQKIVVPLRQNYESMKKEYQHKSKESAARERAHQFGQPGGNPICSQSVAANQRAFYRWVETEATEDELKAYVQDKTKPAIRRNFVDACLNAINKLDPGLYFDLTNQTHGQPKQVIEQTNLPSVEIVLE
jgi:hypothetical protein